MNSTPRRIEHGALKRLDKLQPLLLIASIGLGLALAHLVPRWAATLLPLVTIGVFLLIYLIMLGIGLPRIIQAFSRWKPMMLAIGINFLIIPLLAWALGYVFVRDQPAIWVGLILYLVTPCIGWYLVFTDLAGGDVELGVGLLAWNILLQIALLPVYMSLLAGTIVELELTSVLRSVAIFVLLPLSLASATRYLLWRYGIRDEGWPARIRLPYLKTATLMVVIIAMFASQGNLLIENPGVVLTILLPVALFFVVAFLLALLVGRLTGLRYPEVVLLVFTTTARNSEVSLAIAVTAFASPLVALTVAIGPSIELPALILLVRALLWLREHGFFPDTGRA